MPRKSRDPAATTIICTGCKIVKPVEEFPARKRRCRMCENARQSVYRQRHRDIIQQRSRARHQRLRKARQNGRLPPVDMMQPTLCNTCGKTKPLRDFCRNSGSITGCKQPCKPCSNAWYKSYHRSVRTQQETNGAQSAHLIKQPPCKTCREEKPYSMFYKDLNCRDGYAKSCKTCVQKRYANRVSAIRNKRRNGEMPHVDTSVLWICTHCEQTKFMHEFTKKSRNMTGYGQPCLICKRSLYTKNRQHALQVSKIWQKAHPDKVRSSVASRRARRQKAFVEAVDYGALYRRDRGICQLQYSGCAGRVTMKKGSVDHIIPLALGGQHSYKNTQLACLSCNQKKNAYGKGDQMRLF